MKKITTQEASKLTDMTQNMGADIFSFERGFNLCHAFYNKAFEMGYLPYKSYDNSIKWVNSDGDNLIGDQMFDAVRKEMGI